MINLTKISSRIDLTSQTAIVTGGAKGIGASVARTLAREGANVVVSDIISTENVVNEIVSNGGTAISNLCDITNERQVNKLVNQTIERFGKIDILVANAGIVDRENLADLTIDNWKRVIDVNLTGTFITVQAVYKHMRERRYGKIVCIGSVAGHVGGVISGPHYVASKGGIHSFVKRAAKEAASYGIYINGIAPGPVNSDMTKGWHYKPEEIPLKRLGEPEDIAEAALFLSSQASNYITGIILDVNGGIYMG